jgi:glycosyltransferase involved in cell wall biosynthesis
VLSVLAATGRRRGHFWVHDFSSVCANYALMRNDVTFCGAPPPESGACEVCVYGDRRWAQLGEHLRLFEALDLTVAAPSQAALDLWRSSFPAARTAPTLTHPHAILEPLETVEPGPVSTRRRLEQPARVAFLGMPAPHKGWPVYAELVERFGQDRRYAFHHLAHKPDLTVDAAFTSLAGFVDAQPMITAVEALEIDVAIIWSLCPETFCFTAYEAAAAGALILTNPDAGNVPVFVRGGGHGWVLEDERALFDLFAGGDVLRLRRGERTVRRSALAYSRMTADLIERAAA